MRFNILFKYLTCTSPVWIVPLCPVKSWWVMPPCFTQHTLSFLQFNTSKVSEFWTGFWTKHQLYLKHICNSLKTCDTDVALECKIPKFPSMILQKNIKWWREENVSRTSMRVIRKSSRRTHCQKQMTEPYYRTYGDHSF